MQKEPFLDAKGGSFFVCRKFYNWHSVDGGLTPIKSAKATILAKPIFSTVLVELDTPLKERMDVPVDCVYWTKQD